MTSAPSVQSVLSVLSVLVCPAPSSPQPAGFLGVFGQIQVHHDRRAVSVCGSAGVNVQGRVMSRAHRVSTALHLTTLFGKATTDIKHTHMHTRTHAHTHLTAAMSPLLSSFTRSLPTHTYTHIHIHTHGSPPRATPRHATQSRPQRLLSSRSPWLAQAYQTHTQSSHACMHPCMHVKSLPDPNEKKKRRTRQKTKKKEKKRGTGPTND